MRRLMATIMALRAPGGLFRGLLAIGLLVLPVLAQAQGRVFYEPGDGSSKAATDCRSTTTSRDGAPHRNGAALECGWDGTLDWQNSSKTRELELLSVPMKSERLVSAWFRVDANVDARGGSKLMRLGYPSANEIIISCQFENATPTIWMGLNGHASYWGGTSAANCRDGWKRIRIYQSPSLVRLWLGDALLREWTGTFAISSMVGFMSNWSGDSNPGWAHDALNHVYWDDIEIFSDAGTGGTGSMRDGTMTQGGSTPPPPPPPTPVDCAGVWAETLSAPTPASCDATQQQTRTRTRTFTVVTPAAHGGQACPASPVVTAETTACVYVPPPPPPVPTLVGRFASQATYASGGVSGLRVTLRVSAAQPMPALGAAVSLRVPLANGASEMRSGRVRSTRANAYSGGDGQIVVEMPGLNAIGLELQLPQ